MPLDVLLLDKAVFGVMICSACEKYKRNLLLWLSCFGGLIELLEISTAEIFLVARTQDHHHGPSIGHGIRKTREPMDASEIRDREKDSGSTR
ncbi:hypothetical protein ACFX15_000172 [Malus domestica]